MDRSSLVRFGAFAFDRDRLVLQGADRCIPIGSRGAAILAALVDAGGQVVTRSELLDAAWPSQVVEERNLTVQIALLRRAMGNPPEELDPIRTVSGVGYRLMREAPRASIAELTPSVAVLPFANLSGDPGFAFFADGVTEDIIAALSRFRTFAVVARTSSVPFGAHGASSAEAMAALRVRYVVDGSVRREGHRLRVGARLTDAAGPVLWSDRFDEDLDGVFEVQDRITAAVVGLIEPQITRAEVERSRRKQPQSLDAYDHFLRGLDLFNHPGTGETHYDHLVDHLDRAVALDPSFPEALARAGFAHELRRTLGGATSPGADDFAIALALCDQALEQAPDEALVLAIAAMEIHNLRDDGEAGVALAERAVALNPFSHPVLGKAACVLRQRGRAERALGLYERALRLNPASPSNAMTVENIGCCHLDVGRYDEALDCFERALDMGASWDLALVNLTVAHAMLGQSEQAKAALQRVLAARPGATVRSIMDRLPAGTRQSVEHVWPEGLRRAGLPDR